MIEYSFSRRQFLGYMGAGMAILAMPDILHTQGTIKEVAPDVFMHTDSCNAYCIRSGDEAILIDCGQGGIWEHLAELGIKRVAWILHTHPHRDLSQGDELFIRTGTKIAVHKDTREFYENAVKRWRVTQTYLACVYGPKHFLPLKDIPVSRTLSDGDTFTWNDITLRVLNTPGHTATHLSYILIKDGRKYIFSGDMIHSPGKLWELDALHSYYEELLNWPTLADSRVPEFRASLASLRNEKPDMLLPAHGEPFGNCDAGLKALEDNFSRMLEVMAMGADGLGPAAKPSYPQITMYPSSSCNYLLKADDGHAILFDAGFDGWQPNALHLTDAILAEPGLKQIDLLIPSHEHGDHVARFNTVKKKYGSKVYAHECLKELFEEPSRFFLTCQMRYPIMVDRTFKDGESVEWHGYKLTFYHFPGQTWWHQATLLEGHGLRILFTGDSIDGTGHIRCMDTWNLNLISDTEGAAKCVEVLEKTRPDAIATGHWGMAEFKPEYIEQMREFVKERNAILRKIIAQEDANLGYDIYWARLDPYRSVMPGEDRQITIKARIRNHLDRKGKARLKITLPDGWKASPQVINGVVAPKSEGSFAFTVTAPRDAERNRHFAGLDVTMNGVKYGELGMCLIDVGGVYNVAEDNLPPYVDVHLQKDYGLFPEDTQGGSK